MKRVMLAAMLASACGSASAAVVTFINTDPSFTLEIHDVINDPAEIPSWRVLDITQPVTSQPAKGTLGPSWSVRVVFEFAFTWAESDKKSLWGNTNSAVAYTEGHILDGWSGLPMAVDVPELFDPGDAIGAGSHWGGGARLWEFNTRGRWDFIPWPDSAFVGLRITLPDGVHYGFVEIERFDFFGSPRYRPLSWGYETEVGVPLVLVPAPGAAVLLASAGLIARRRR